MKMTLLRMLCLGLFLTACASSGNPPARTEVVTPTATSVATIAARSTTPPTETVIATPAATEIPQAPTDTPQPQPTETAPPTGRNFTLALTPLIESGLEHPDYLTHAGDERLFVVEQPGRIRIIENGQLLAQPFLDITDKVDSEGTEQGLLSVAFHPAYKTNRQFFVDYTRQPDGATVVERYTVTPDDPNRADAQSGTVILTIDQPEANHNGGLIKFGPRGLLYIGTGDGGGRGDQHGSTGNGQDRNALLGKLLRINVTNQETYTIPSDNPFGTEVWAYGLRNPWRFSFDRANNDLYIADVGQDTYEEVDFQPSGSKGGENYGWRLMEGRHCYDPQTGCDQTGLVLPVAEYSHDEGGCSITGGYVYRGAQYYTRMNGVYFFGDYCTGYLWSLEHINNQWVMTKRLETGKRLSSFGEGSNGELYVINHDGGVYQLTAN